MPLCETCKKTLVLTGDRWCCCGHPGEPEERSRCCGAQLEGVFYTPTGELLGECIACGQYNNTMDPDTFEVRELPVVVHQDLITLRS